MKVIKRLKRTVGKCLFALMVFNSMTPALLAVESSMMMQDMQPEMMSAQEGGLDCLVMEMVQKAASMDMDCAPSAALMRCYERIVGGYKTLLVEDVMQAMPELLGYALMKHQNKTTRSARPGMAQASQSYEQVKAPRPIAADPYDPAAVVGPILQDQANCLGDLSEVINLLLVIKKRIGTVNDPVCANTVLGVLGDACTILGADTSIAQAIRDGNSAIIKQLDCIEFVLGLTAPCREYAPITQVLPGLNMMCEQQEECTEQIIEKLDELLLRNDRIEELECLIECKLGDFNDCDDCDDCDDSGIDCNDCFASKRCGSSDCDVDCKEECKTFDNVSQGLSEIFCKSVEIENTLTTCCATIQDNFEFTWSLIEHIPTNTGFCCDEILKELAEIKAIVAESACITDCKLGEFNDCNNFGSCDDCDCDDCDCNDNCIRKPATKCGSSCDVFSSSDCDDCNDDCSKCPTFDNVSQGLSEIFCNVTECCELTQSNFEFTWSLIEHIPPCDFTEILTTLIACCEETHSLLHVILDTVTQCCDDLADDIFDTQTILCHKIADLKETLTECCDDLADDIYDTQTIIIECCEITQSNFEFTWSLIEECCEQTQSNFEYTWSLIEECCEQTQSNFEFTWSLIEECCEQTQSNFEYTWSLIENLENIVEKCCEQTQSNFEHTWSLIENLENIVEKCCENTQSAIEVCCEQTQSNFEHTWSLIENLENIVEKCCEQTQSNFEHTWSLIENLDNVVVKCCEQTQSNFEHTWSLIENLENIVEKCCENTQSAIEVCCEQTQSNFEHTWSLIEECCEQTQSNFEHTFSLLDELEECCKNNCAKLECIKELLQDNCDVSITVDAALDITVPGIYCLVNNIVGQVHIKVGDVILNLNGFQITNTTGDAIVVDTVTNVTIKDGIVSALNNTGINLNAPINVNIANVDFVGCAVGLAATSAFNLLVDQCAFYNGKQALVLDGVVSGSINACQCLLNTAASADAIISLTDVCNFTVLNSIISNNSCSGAAPVVELLSACKNLKCINTMVNENVSTSGAFAAIKATTAASCIFQNCEFNLNQGVGEVHGLWLLDCSNVQALGCTAYKNLTTDAGGVLSGLCIDGTSAACSIVDCVANNHTNTALSAVGIKVSAAASRCNLSGNTLLSNNNGIVNSGLFTGVTQNYASGNGALPLLTNYAGVDVTLIATLVTGILGGSASSLANLSVAL